MRARSLLASALIAAALITFPTVTKAEPMDPALERLVLNPGCHGLPSPTGGVSDFGAWNPKGGAGTDGKCLADNAAFARLVNQYGAALAPTAMHAARTTGYGGFELSLDGSFTSLDDGADYWKQGTRGSIDPSTSRRSIRNNSPDPVAQVYYLKARKGFPFGFELTGLLGTMSHTSFTIIGADARLALLEGFRKGVFGYFPDVAVGGGVRTVTGSPQLQLTTVAIDGQLSKPIPIADSSSITPYVGYQYLWIFGDSGMIDTTPTTDAIGLCGYEGANIPGTPGTPVPGPTGDKPYDGQPVCNGGTPLDFNNTLVFNEVRLQRQRIILGANYRFEMLSVGLQYLTDIVSPEKANKGKNLEGVPTQFTISAHLGAIF